MTEKLPKSQAIIEMAAELYKKEIEFSYKLKIFPNEKQLLAMARKNINRSAIFYNTWVEMMIGDLP